MQCLSSRSSAMGGLRVAVTPARALFPAPSRSLVTVEAAVPKKKTSKSKRSIRKAAWKKEVNPYVTRALFLAKMALTKGEGRESRDSDMQVASATAATEAPPAESS